MTASHKCQRCGKHPIKWRAVSSIINLSVCVVCADEAITKHGADKFDYYVPRDYRLPRSAGKITILRLESGRKQ